MLQSGYNRECEFCHRKFRFDSAYRQHVVIHTGERPFPCNIENCTSSFNRRSNLNLHLRNVHKVHIEYRRKKEERNLDPIIKNEHDVVQ